MDNVHVIPNGVPRYLRDGPDSVDQMLAANSAVNLKGIWPSGARRSCGRGSGDLFFLFF